MPLGDDQPMLSAKFFDECAGYLAESVLHKFYVLGIVNPWIVSN